MKKGEKDTEEDNITTETQRTRSSEVGLDRGWRLGFSVFFVNSAGKI